MSVQIGTFKRVMSFTATIVPAGAPAPSPTAVKVATDIVLNVDIYLDSPAFSWIPA